MKKTYKIIRKFPAVSQVFYGSGGADKKERQLRKQMFKEGSFKKQKKKIDGFLEGNSLKIHTKMNPDYKGRMVNGIFEPITGALWERVIVNEKEVLLPIHRESRHIHFDTEKESYLYWLEYALNLLENKIKASN